MFFVLPLQTTTPVPAHANLTKIVSCISGIRRLLIIIKVVTPANTAGMIRRIHPQCPASNIKSMNSIISKFTTTIRPVPMPVVVDQIILVGSHRNRSLPKLVIKVCWNCRRLPLSNRPSLIVIPATCISKLPNHASLEFFNPLAKHWSTPSLIAHLHFPIGPLSCCHHELGLPGIMTPRFLNINMLP